MTDWIIIAVMLLQIPVLLIFSSKMYGIIVLNAFENKNLEWLKAHPEFDKPQKYLKRLMLGCVILALVSLAAIVQWVWLQPSTIYYVGLIFFPMMTWVVLFYGFFALAYRQIYKKIPSAGTVRASLTHRKLFDYVPAWLVYLGSILFVAVLLIYVWAFATGFVPSQIAISRLIGLSVLLVGIALMIRMELRRKTNLMVEVFGPNARKYQLCGLVAMLYMGFAVGVFRIMGDMFDSLPMSDLHVFTLFSLGMQIYTVIFGLLPKTRQLMQQYKQRHTPT